MGVQKTVDKFKMKFSCKTSNIIWDFGKEYAPDSVMLYAPFGSLLLKIIVPKGSSTNFERNKWRSNIEKLFNEGDSSEDKVVNGFEQCYVSWVSAQCKCVFSHTFLVNCKSQNEAKEKIFNLLKQKDVEILHKQNPMGELVPLICFDFQTIRSNEREERDIIADMIN